MDLARLFLSVVSRNQYKLKYLIIKQVIYSWFPPIYNDEGLNKEELELQTQKYVIRTRVGIALGLPASIGAPNETRNIMIQSRSCSVFSLNK
jgi:hypothetical protein